VWLPKFNGEVVRLLAHRMETVMKISLFKMTDEELLRFGREVRRLAENRRVASSNLARGATFLIFCTEELTAVSFYLFRTGLKLA
jgi:chorismate mutase